MKRMFMAIAVVVALVAAGAAAAAPAAKDPRVPRLQRDVVALRGQIATLTAAVQRNADSQQCFMAFQLNQDQGFLNLFALLVGRPDLERTPSASDNGACARVGLPPQPAARTLAGATSSIGTLAASLGRASTLLFRVAH